MVLNPWVLSDLQIGLVESKRRSGWSLERAPNPMGGVGCACVRVLGDAFQRLIPSTAWILDLGLTVSRWVSG